MIQDAEWNGSGDAGLQRGEAVGPLEDLPCLCCWGVLSVTVHTHHGCVYVCMYTHCFCVSTETLFQFHCHCHKVSTGNSTEGVLQWNGEFLEDVGVQLSSLCGEVCCKPLMNAVSRSISGVDRGQQSGCHLKLLISSPEEGGEALS